MGEPVQRKYKDLVAHEEDFDNPRERFDMSKIKELAASIKERGLTYPLQVWETEKNGEKMALVIGGARRLKAIGLLVDSGDWPEGRGIECNITKAKTLKDAQYDAVDDNMHREDLSSYEMAKSIASLKMMGDAQNEIAKRLGKSEAWVSRHLMAFEKAATPLKNAWKAGKIPVDTVMDLAKLDPEEQKAEVEVQLAMREKAGRAGQSKARKAAKKKTKKAQRAGAKELQGLLLYAEKAPRSESPYCKGVYDTLRFALGLIEEEDFGADFKRFRKELDKKLAAEAEEEERTKKNGHAEAAA